DLKSHVRVVGVGAIGGELDGKLGLGDALAIKRGPLFTLLYPLGQQAELDAGDGGEHLRLTVVEAYTVVHDGQVWAARGVALVEALAAGVVGQVEDSAHARLVQRADRAPLAGARHRLVLHEAEAAHRP